MDIRLTPSLLAWLRCFEATARCHSFTRAASELCVTQGAVSQQVKHLEDWLGRALLLRTPRSLVPTPEGQWLAVVLRESFQAIEGTLGQLREVRPDQPTGLSCAPSFAMGWLTPRLGDFYRAHPDVGLRVVGEFHALDRERMARDDVQAAVRFDLGDYRDLQAVAFLDEWLVPVASPAFLAAHPDLREPGDLRPAMLLHDDSPWAGAGPTEEWRDWLRHAGVEPADLAAGHHFNLSQLAVGAALAGQGIAIGRAALVLDDLDSGRLVAPFGRPLRARFLLLRHRHGATAAGPAGAGLAHRAGDAIPAATRCRVRRAAAPGCRARYRRARTRRRRRAYDRPSLPLRPATRSPMRRP